MYLGNQLTNTVAGTTYSISFEVAGCGGTNDVRQVDVNGVVISSFVAQGDCNTWTTASGTFVGSGDDLIRIFVGSTSSLASSQWYFDNFVVEAV